MNALRPRRGFTLVELLVVIAIIGILVALLLPAVQSAREAARRMQCSSNLKQMGIALHNYHDTYKYFPPASHWAPGVNIEQVNNPNLRENWIIMILPFIEQEPLYVSFDLRQPIPHAVNAVPRSARLEVMLCPSNGDNRKPFNGSANSGTNQMGDNWGRGNYAANSAMGFMTDRRHSGVSNAAYRDSEGWKSSTTRGVMGANVACRMADITDGTSNTILVGEIRAGVVEFDSRGVWAMSGGCPSSLWAHGWIGDDRGPNAPFPDADDVLACQAIKTKLGGGNLARGTQRLQEMRMACSSGDWPNFQQTMRSEHLGNGALTVFGDGSVHWISDYIETSSSYIPSAWDRLNLSSDGFEIKAGSFN